jgi:phosphoribosylformylglycinamidine synthase
MSVKRIFVEKKEGFDILANRIHSDIVDLLKINASAVRVFHMYDIENVSEYDIVATVDNVFSEPPCDNVFMNKLPWLFGYKVFAVEYLLGQYDQRADSAEQCVQLLLNKNRPIVKTATVYAIKNISDDDLKVIKKYLVNQTDSKILPDINQKPDTLESNFEDNDTISFIEDFIDLYKPQLKKFYESLDLAMSLEDLIWVAEYFKAERRNPSETELKVIDTYWSDHCRHTTFNTELVNIGLGNNRELRETYNLYRNIFKQLYAEKPEKYMSLMDIATICLKAINLEKELPDLDVSDEINACSIVANVSVNQIDVPYLVMFKNETHNHPTEIEPFGGAATCLGGAIRDPLSGRAFVYQSMRITGAGNVYQDINETLPGKLPQRVISKTATAGFSSYGNQIGLATGIVRELYHDNFVAKRLETGFVIGAAPKENVERSKPTNRDKIILLGGDTGRDGCGGATGSSKAHKTDSVDVCGAEVQKGNPLIERKIQRFFRNKSATTLIKRCNDFGAGGVAVAIGELADGLDIYLELVPKKYKGLSVTETAISESQERMAVVVSESDADTFIQLAREENLKATVVAEVTNLNRLRMFNKGELTVDIKRDFLNTAGVKQKADVYCKDFKRDGLFECYSEEVRSALEDERVIDAIKAILSDKNVMLQKGMGETFDSSIGAGSVFLPFGGRHQLTPALCMAAKIPTNKGYTDTTSVSTWAFDPKLTDDNPFVGSLYATLASITKLVVSGLEYSSIRLTLQEFFKRPNGDPYRLGDPFAALLGSLCTQYNISVPAIGGKDSMSGSFEELDVPNTLISFAVGISDAHKLISNVFKDGDLIYRIPVVTYENENFMPNFTLIKKLYQTINREILYKNVTSATVVESGGAVSAIIKSAIGNKLGVSFKRLKKIHFESRLGDIIIATKDVTAFKRFSPEHIASITNNGIISYEDFGEIKQIIDDPLRAFLLPEMLEDEEVTQEIKEIPIEEAIELLSGHEKLYPTTAKTTGDVATFDFSGFYKYPSRKTISSFGAPRVLIPVFPGTNCEFDTAMRFENEGAIPEILVIKNSTSDEVKESVERLTASIKNSQIIAFPGGFSGGDEPDGSGKFIASTFRNPYILEAVHSLLNDRDGLILGICNGFQALIKLGLLPYGKIKKLSEDSPTLTYNVINRHVSNVVKIRVTGNHSPWLSSFNAGQIFATPISHGEGRFVANDAELEKLIRRKQIATQYVDDTGKATLLAPYNPNGSYYAIEGLISDDGRILGKMGHCERYQKNIYRNLPEDFDFDMNIFLNGVNYFKSL